MKKILPLFLGIFLCASILGAEKKEEKVRTVALVTVDGGINPGTADYILKSIEIATDRGDECVIIRLNTPGGLLTSTRSIVQGIFDAKLPVIVWVAPGGAHAGSAGVLITLASHVAAMAPGTNIGAAHPVTGEGKDIGGEIEKKVTNDAAAFAESIAQTRKRNTKWAIDAVRQSVSITAQKAKDDNVIDLLANRLDDLLEQLDGKTIQLKEKSVTIKTKGAVVEPLDMNLKQRIISLLGDPNVLYILMMIAALGIYFELAHPGAIFPGVLGAIALILAFVSAQTLPINYGAILLILLGIALLIAEIFVTSFGVLGIGGIASFVLGSIFLIDTNLTTKGVSWYVIIPSVIAVTSFLLIVSYMIFRSQRSRVVTGQLSLVGEVGVVTKEIEPGKPGKIFIRGEIWNATADVPIKRDERVEITDVKGLSVKVAPKKE